MPQLQINQGPQDALLYDNSRSYFTNVGYVRTSNFQVEYKEVESVNTATWGGQHSYVIPKAADLLGPTDLMVTIPAPEIDGATETDEVSGTENTNSHVLFSQFVDELGFAMLEKITFQVGSNVIEELTGEELQLRNELMTSDEMRLGYGHVLKTGTSAFANLKTMAGANLATKKENLYHRLPADSSRYSHIGTVTSGAANFKPYNRDTSRLIAVATDGGATSTNNFFMKTGETTGTNKVVCGERKLIIPLGLFYTKHVSQYFPLAAVAGCNDVRITIKFRPIKELIQLGGYAKKAESTKISAKIEMPKMKDPVCKLMCHYVHVTGPEAQTLMNKEHVRLLKQYQHTSKVVKHVTGTKKWELDLSFLHPCSTLLITVRKNDDVGNTTGDAITQAASTGADFGMSSASAASKGFFFYHGDGTNPNYDDATSNQTVQVKSIELTLNGQQRHPGLSGGIDVEYLQHRLLPQLHSNSNQVNKYLAAHNTGFGDGDGQSGFASQSYGTAGSKNIFVYPFSLNPEGSNPSGAVNFSKVSHAKLQLHLADYTYGPASPADPGVDYLVDVYALNYNWLQIKDGRALLSFA